MNKWGQMCNHFVPLLRLVFRTHNLREGSRPVKKALLGITVAAMALGSAAMVIGQSRPQTHSGTAENKLVGISLFDTGAKVVSMYGSPDEILALTPGGAAAGGGGAAGGDGGRGGAPAGAAGGGRGGSAPAADRQIRPDNGFIGDPFGPNTEWQQAAAAATAGAPAGDEGGGAAGRGGPGGPASPGGGGAAAGGSSKVVYTRWVYKRNNSRYAFVLDKFNRVIQMEAIGLKNSAVKTRRGITFGSSFASLIKAYNAPDSYEVNGDNLVVRFLVRDRVAFRLNRLQADKPQVVTGIVVAAAKT